MLSAAEELLRFAMVFASSEKSMELRIGQNGLVVLVLQFPAEVPKYFADAKLTPQTMTTTHQRECLPNMPTIQFEI